MNKNLKLLGNDTKKGAWIDLQPLDTEAMNPHLMRIGLEVYADHTCGVPQSPVNCNCYFVDLSEIVEFYSNKWLVPLAFANRFVDEGMRAFPDSEGVVVGSTMDEEDFYERFNEIATEINAKICKFGKGVM